VWEWEGAVGDDLQDDSLKVPKEDAAKKCGEDGTCGEREMRKSGESK
tara:strand:+ start:114 stop:254 length:141 start_codon:yes stop_codon:yes gene_type:complete